ncbi:MAG: hypothetical protein ACT4OI_06600 [Methanobacteriota archaeon]
MADVRAVAAVLALLPFLAILLYAIERFLAERREETWGVLVGLVAFLAVGHAMAEVLFAHPFLSIYAGEVFALFVLVAGLLIGMRLSWQLVGHPERWRMSVPTSLAWAGAGFLALHSLGDGLALGEAFVALTPEVRADGLAIAATIVHRFAEGSLVVLPALAAGWRLRKSLGALFLGLFLLPGAAVTAAILQPPGGADAAALALAIRSVVAAAEAGFGLLLLLGGLAPQAAASHRTRWVGWAGIAFIAIAVVHGIVE